MSSLIQKLISDGLLEEFDKPISAVEKRLEDGKQRLLFAKTSFTKDVNEDFLDAIYISIYDAVRFVGEAFLLLNGYRAKLKDHHKTVINVTRELMEDEEDMKNVLKRLNKMRKKRHELDYDFDAYGASRVAISKAMEDAEKFVSKVSKALVKKKSPAKN